MSRVWGHDNLAEDLASHLVGPRRMVWCNMQLGPSGSPRPDVYCLDKSYARPSPTAYEVKVSVSDFRADVTAGKWQSYLDYAGAVIFAAPAGLLPPTEIPPMCGLIVCHEVAWRLAKTTIAGEVLEDGTCMSPCQQDAADIAREALGMPSIEEALAALLKKEERNGPSN